MRSRNQQEISRKKKGGEGRSPEKRPTEEVGAVESDHPVKQVEATEAQYISVSLSAFTCPCELESVCSPIPLS